MAQHDTDELPQQTGGEKFIAGLLLFHILKQGVHHLSGRPARREQGVNACAVSQHRGVFLAADRTVLQKTVHIEHDAFIHTVVRRAAVHRPTGHKHTIARAGTDGLAVYGKGKAAFQNKDQLTFHVPVERHLIARMQGVHVVKLNGKVKCTAHHALMKGKISHRKMLSL